MKQNQKTAADFNSGKDYTLEERVRLYQDGDRTQGNAIANECRKLIYILINGSNFNYLINYYGTKEDFIQTVLCDFFENINRYDAARGKVFTFLKTLCVHTVSDLHHSYKKEHQNLSYEDMTEQLGESFQALLTPTSDCSSAEDMYFQNYDASIVVHELLDRLQTINEHYYEAVRLHKLEGKTLEESARLLGKSVPTVTNWSRRGMQKLKDFELDI